MKLFLLWMGFVLCVAGVWAAGAKAGMTRAEVEEALGKPLSTLSQGELTILNYPDRGRVELTAGRVTLLVRVAHADDEPAVAAAAESNAPVASGSDADEWESADASAQAGWAAADAESRARLEESVERLSAGPGAYSENEDHESGFAAHFWAGLGIGLMVQVAVGMVILKLAFAWTDVHADWGQMFLPALTASLAGAVVQAGAYAVWESDQLFHTDDAVSYGALLFTLMKSTHACTWQRAAGVAMAAKLMSIVVWTFLGVAISRALFA